MGFRNQLINENKKEKYRKRMENSKNAEKELGYALILLDKESQVAKAELYGKAYGLFVNESISWDRFVEFSEAISRMFMIDFNHLEKLATGLPLQAGVKEEELYGFQRLKGLGLIEEENVSFEQGGLVFKKEFHLTSFGNALVELIAVKDTRGAV